MNLLRKLRNPKGFTLVELIIVIMIIGILAATMLPKVMGGPARARDAQRKSNLQAISTALELFYTDNDNYPVVTTLSTELAGYMSNIAEIVDDPQNTVGYQYIYCYGTTNGIAGQEYALATRLESGTPRANHTIGTKTALVDTVPTDTAIGVCDNASGNGGGDIS